MFLLNILTAENAESWTKFTIQNVPIKSRKTSINLIAKTAFTIQNVPIKSYIKRIAVAGMTNLQYKMFLLN